MQETLSGKRTKEKKKLDRKTKFTNNFQKSKSGNSPGWCNNAIWRREL